MKSILFICHGNICRSPMAEFMMKELVAREGRADKFVIASAATSTEEIGNGIHRGTRRILQQNGIYCEGHRAVQMTRADYEKYDYLIGMDEANIRNMLRIVGEDREKKFISFWILPGARGRLQIRGTQVTLKPPTPMSGRGVRRSMPILQKKRAGYRFVTSF